MGTTELYNPAVAVLLTEVMKLVALAMILGVQEVQKGPMSLTRMKEDAMRVVRTAGPMIVPAGLFTAQQQLNLVAASGLDAVTFQVTNQFKILPTALFSVVMLDKGLTLQQWLSLPLLGLGVAVVNNSTQGDQGHQEVGPEGTKWWVGLVCSLLAGVTSGYAGVYFEKALKSSVSPVSLWAMNVQLSVFGAAFAGMNVFGFNRQFVEEHGLLHGFGPSAWTVVALQAIGGLIVAVVVRYADNILKGFASAVSIVVSWVLSIPLFDLVPNSMFAFGIALVVFALLLYSAPPISQSHFQIALAFLRRNSLIALPLAVFICFTVLAALVRPSSTLTFAAASSSSAPSFSSNRTLSAADEAPSSE